MAKPQVNVAVVGCGFMGRAHSNALGQVRAFFDLRVEPVKKVLCCRNPETRAALAQRFGWQDVADDWREVVTRADVDVVDIATPVYTHMEIALAALAAGKAVICEKPLARDLAEARAMADAADAAGVTNMTMFNLRATPAITLAQQMIAEGAIGAVNQWRGTYLQGHMVDPNLTLTWRMRKETAGAGALGDIGSHSVDLAHFLVGRISEVCGMLRTYTRQRWIPVKDEGRNSVPSDKLGEVTVDDAAWALLRFANGADGSLEASRMATGRLNANRFEVSGSEGGLAFDFMRLNELEYFSLADPPRLRGWRTIHVTAPVHPYVKAWWPAGHSIGYEHTFVHALANFFTAYHAGTPAAPTFREGAQVQAVLQAIEESNTARGWVSVAQV